ncbi:glycoside hydrolase family 31 protein [bacterium BMS3Abin03]|nr:glycoside hydrolase family 31 protein [bacterium BMS3Abin03]
MNFKYTLFVSLFPLLCLSQVVENYKQLGNEVNINLTEGTLNISSMADNAVRIKFYQEVENSISELIFTSTDKNQRLNVTDLPSKLELKGERIIVFVDKQTGNLSFANYEGKIFLNEKAGTRKLIPDSVMGEPCFIAEQSFESPKDEYLFGLGQFQDGHYNLRNITRCLTQVNSQISLPFIYSSKGHGLLWHQYGLTDFNPADNFINLEKQEQSAEGNDQVAEVTTTSGTQKVSQHQSLYTGQFKVPADGVYSIFLNLGDMDNRQYVVIDGKPSIDISNFWLPPTADALVNLKAGKHRVQLVCKSSNTPKLSWKLTGDETTFRSPNAKLLDYVVFYGPSADSVIATYRNLSGNVPMLPRWAYGFWQCRERYTSGTQLVEAVKEFRKRKIPVDVIVQDWQYWGDNGWGVPEFDDKNYSNPASFIKEIHNLNAHFNISIWSNPDKNSAIGKEYVAKNLYIPGSKWLDYFNPLTRKYYWNTLKKNLFSYGVDSWWMDATEPENDALHGQKTYLGPGDFYRLAYPLFVSRAVYEGQRETTSQKRVCILTRSAFLGQQRYGTINWSGDVGGNWDAYKKQIVAGLNYTITGMPYWTTDIGGFFRPGKSQYTDENYQELLIRWYQWGAFNPVFRIHGYQSETEPWHYSKRVQDDMQKMLNLRYRLMPYIYSEAWQVTKNGSTIMRPLVMDFCKDNSALNRLYEYMFGKSFLVAPVTEPKVNERDVYLPESVNWYDFRTGKYFEGGQTIKAEAPLDEIPLYIKAGSIIPMGPAIQYATEKSDPVEIRIYLGADGEFTLYEDENDNYNYEKGIYSTITFNWENEKKELTINDRKGSFPGMLSERKFNIVVVGKTKGVGITPVEKFDQVVTYDGKKVVVKL